MKDKIKKLKKWFYGECIEENCENYPSRYFKYCESHCLQRLMDNINVLNK